MEMQFRSPRNPLEWVVTVLVFGVVLALAVALSAVVIVVIGIAIILGPIISWWRARKGPPPNPPGGGPPPEGEPPSGRVLDVDFEVKEDV